MSVRTLRYSSMSLHTPKSMVASTDRDAWAFLEAATIYNTNQQRAIIRLVRDLKRTGLWSKMKAIYPFVGGTATTHKWNLKDPRDLDAAFRLTFSGGWTHSSTGALPNGSTGYANTFLANNTLGQNSTHFGFYSRTDSNTLTVDMGCDSTSGSSPVSLIIPRYAGSYYCYVNNSSAVNQFNVVVSNSLGLIIGNRNSASAETLYKNGSLLGTSTNTSYSPTSNTFYLAARNRDGSASRFGSRQFAFATIGDGLTDTDATNLYNIVDLYQKRLGRAV